MTRRVLVPMDDSEPARSALTYALERYPEDDLLVAHAVDDLEAGYGGGSPAGGDGERPALFDDAATLAADYGREIETRTLDGQAAEAILAFVREGGIDEVVMGSEGRSGVSRMLLGSVAEQVTRRSPVPVTIVP